MEEKKVSISDIAKELNISITTVSFIINGKAKEKRISDSLVDRVLKLVEEKNYQPNQLAKSLRTGKTNILGLMVEDIANPFFANVARLIEENAYKEGYKILYCSTENSTEKTKELIRMFIDRRIDGYIITPPKGIKKDILLLNKENSPVVLFDRYYPDLEADYVVVDNYEGTSKAIEHFIEQGFKNIAFVTIESDQTQMLDRLRGYQNVMDKYHIPQIIERIPYQETSGQAVKQIVELLKRNKKIDAIFFATNYLGVNGLEALKSTKLKIGKDIGVISFDDHDLFRLYNPTITAVAQPIEEISKLVISILLGKLSGHHRNGAQEINSLQTRLIVRESSLRLTK
ncbi:MAG: substrate-binding domain-containing protein [Candidatus Pedobacter colombiensis]|uniref:Substrate-binding domain-containing protein n=1 Tax=Candidatus Pedobacter colombiensis TaxID=3121371 RepID=A0AAJ5W7G3_9SPHI|nr:substrate-binding domain-containing protein [Pedobacter sp.]WEK19958.1 MAG: substrate-binding domain-containing protein [Pedobacter sp.]